MTILSLDLATTTGYAILRADGSIVHGEQSFAGHPREGEGARFLKFQMWLVREIAQPYPDLERIVYEKVIGVGPSQAFAAQIHGGFRALMLMFADIRRIPCDGFNVTTVKKQFVGSGKATKDDVMAQCRSLGFKVQNHNEADALAILHVATNTCPILTMSGATPKKKRKPELAERPF